MTKTTALLAKYLGLFEKNPTGQVFAPLAETYRKMGMHKEAMEVLKKGLRHHPHYILGLIVLAHCHFDQGHLEQAYRILTPIVHQEQDNLMLQKLFAQISYKLYAYKDALQAYKNVLFVNPTDEEAKLKIKELEEQEQNYYAYMKQGTSSPEFSQESSDLQKKNISIEDIGEWKSLQQQEQVPEPIQQTEDTKVVNYLKNISVDEAHAWTVKQWSVSQENESAPSMTPMTNSPSSDDGANTIMKTHDENESLEKTEEVIFSNDSSSSNINLDSYQNISPTDEIPIVTHTLIDIFCSQKHYDKALELLDKVIKHDPTDERSKQKKLYVLSKMQESKSTTSKKMPSPGSSPSVAVSAEPKQKTAKEHKWNEAKYNMLSQRYGKLLNNLKDLGKTH